MNWSDENYVKVYTRDTLTWRSWNWQARTVFLHLTRKLDGAGLIEVGRMDPVDALALQLDLPREVVAEGLPHLLATDTLELVQAGILVPNWIDAQEARKTEAQKKRDQRSRARDQRRATQTTETRKAPVPRCPAVSPAVPLQLSSAQLSSAQKDSAAEKPRRAPKPPADLKAPPDPRHAPLVASLCAIFEAATHARYAFGGRDARAVKDLLALGEPSEVETRWRRALARPAKAFPAVRALHELVANWNHLATDSEPGKGRLAVASHGVGEVPLAF